MIFGAPLASSAVHHGVRLETAETSARSPLDLATASTAAVGLKCATYGTVKPKWKRAESRIAGSLTETSACTANGAWTYVKVEMMTRQMLSTVSSGRVPRWRSATRA